MIRTHFEAVTADECGGGLTVCVVQGFSSVGLSLLELSVNLTTLIQLENCHVIFPIFLSRARVHRVWQGSEMHHRNKTAALV